MDIDLNSDLGEGCGLDGEIMPLVTSANICCGMHAGDYATSFAALGLAGRDGVAVGAHPGYEDREHFGRRELELSEDQVFFLCLYQVGGLSALARELDLPVRYLKPHGALYNQACRDERYARALAEAAEVLGLPLLGLPGTHMETAANLRCRFVPEGFADRRYLPDGTLVPRSRPDAMVTDPEEAVRQAEWLIQEKGVRSLCVHGDNPAAVLFARNLRTELERRGHTLRAFA
jgi:5-oxoprolinase (ATP-hydrolysing) subunit A